MDLKNFVKISIGRDGISSNSRAFERSVTISKVGVYFGAEFLRIMGVQPGIYVTFLHNPQTDEIAIRLGKGNILMRNNGNYGIVTRKEIQYVCSELLGNEPYVTKVNNDTVVLSKYPYESEE